MSGADFGRFLARSRERVARARRAGGYSRDSRHTEADLYGTAAAVGIGIALGMTPQGDDAEELVEGLLALRDDAGMFRDRTHGPTHRAATAVTTIAALGGRPEAPEPLAGLLVAEAAPGFLDGLDWEHPWPASHDAAGLLAIGLVTRTADIDERDRWASAYLAWLDAHADPATGLWPAGGMGRLDDDPGLFGNLGCSFHIHFLYEHLGRRWPSPEGVVDTGLALLHDSEAVLACDDASTEWGFRQLDWVYSIGRAARCGHRTDEVDLSIAMLARRAATALDAPEAVEVDLHVLQARVGLVAELAVQAPEHVLTGEFPSLTSIVDVRPFI